MNQVVISAVITSEFRDTAYDGVSFEVTSKTNEKQPKPDVITLVAYKENAQNIKANAKMGMRVNVIGRLASEKIEGEEKKYHDVVSVFKVMGLMDAKAGSDVAQATIGGLAKVEELRYLPTGTAVLNLNIDSVRNFQGKDSHTFVSGVLWSEKAEKVGEMNLTESSVVIVGALKANPFVDKEGVTRKKLNVWAESISFAEAEAETDAVAVAPEVKPQKKAVPRKSSGSTEDLDF